MSYMILTYGSYDVPDNEYDIDTQEEAMEILRDKVQTWCDEHGVDIDDTDYGDENDIFEYGKEEKGVCIMAIYRVPLLETEADDCLWDAKVEMETAYFAAQDYIYTLTDCDVVSHTIEAQQLIDRAMELMGGWKYEEEN